MASPTNLLDNNRRWSDAIRAQDPDFFARLSKQQSPKYLWIGCSDSRVPANQIVDLPPGEVFVHRNIANIVADGDLNCLAVMQYAIDVLKVEHIMVVGHYGCGGVQAVLEHLRLGLIDDWLQHVGAVMQQYAELLAKTADAERHARLCELNVIEQVGNVCRTAMVRDAWARGQKLAVHGWCYGLDDGRIRDLLIDVARPDEWPNAHECALAAIIS